LNALATKRLLWSGAFTLFVLEQAVLCLRKSHRAGTAVLIHCEFEDQAAHVLADVTERLEIELGVAATLDTLSRPPLLYTIDDNNRQYWERCVARSVRVAAKLGGQAVNNVEAFFSTTGGGCSAGTKRMNDANLILLRRDTRLA
jgi:hypothetical protein